jgi:DNA-directed RNA polymerase sigma subunit (sigma70/sigma32)
MNDSNDSEDLENKEVVKWLLKKLKPPDRRIIEMLMGLDGDNPLRPLDIARKLEITQPECKKRIAEILIKLKEAGKELL